MEEQLHVSSGLSIGNEWEGGRTASCEFRAVNRE